MNYKNELLILYNVVDEEIFKYIETLILSNDDSESEVVGVKDNSVIVFKSLAQDYKRFEYSADKFLFIDCAPVDLPKRQQFNKYGVSYGMIDKDRMYIDIDNTFKWERKTYDSFLSELKELIDNPISNIDTMKKIEKKHSTGNKALKLVSLALLPPVGVALYAVDANSETQSKATRRKQLLYYGITKMYLNDMESVVNT